MTRLSDSRCHVATGVAAFSRLEASEPVDVGASPARDTALIRKESGID